MIGRETDLPDERRLRLRIGVNLGDIIVEGSAHDTGTDGFKADSFCSAKWTVESQRGQGAMVNYDEQINFEATYYEVIADATSPYKELMLTLPAANAGPVSIEACEAALRKIAESYRVDCKFD